MNTDQLIQMARSFNVAHQENDPRCLTLLYRLGQRCGMSPAQALANIKHIAKMRHSMDKPFDFSNAAPSYFESAFREFFKDVG